MEIALLVAISLATLFGMLAGIYAVYKIVLWCHDCYQSLFGTPDAIVLLNGKKKSGKTTIIKLLNHGGFVPSYEATQQAFIKKAAKFQTQNGRRYVFWDTSGLYHTKDAEKLHDILDSFRTKDKIQIISVYVFNLTEYEQIQYAIEAHTKECREKGYIALAFATRGDKLNSTERRNLNAEMSRIFGIPIKVFDLTLAPVEEIIEFIEMGETNTTYKMNKNKKDL
ncbi:MAG: GTPase domain-containing protein [Helicobacter sp.]|nr:GTPase domain-containing protein [Helicobacter sp.]